VTCENKCQPVSAIRLLHGYMLIKRFSLPSSASRTRYLDAPRACTRSSRACKVLPRLPRGVRVGGEFPRAEQVPALVSSKKLDPSIAQRRRRDGD
jgi:hypothetical protein